MNVWKILPVRSWIILAVVVVLCIGFLSWCDARRDAQAARLEGQVAGAQAQLGADALKRDADRQAANKAADAVTDANRDFITGADNADQDAGEAGRRGRLAYCERQRVRQRPEPAYCARLRVAYQSVPTPAG